MDREYVLEYLREHTSDVDSTEEISERRDEFVHRGIEQLLDESSDPNG